MLMRYFCSMIACYFFSRHNRFAETHSYLQLSYQITDRLLAAGNKTSLDNVGSRSENKGSHPIPREVNGDIVRRHCQHLQNQLSISKISLARKASLDDIPSKLVYYMYISSSLTTKKCKIQKFWETQVQ